MFQLPLAEQVIFWVVLLLGLAAALAGIFQLRKGAALNGLLLSHLLAVTLLLEAGLLILRASEKGAIPLTGLFESLLVLTLVFGVMYLIFGVFIRQVWFGSIASWVILVLLVLTALAAEPAEGMRDTVPQPWALAHGMAMALGGAMTMLGAAAAILYLVGHRRLKHGQFSKVLGVVPNLENLKRLNRWALRIAFVFFSLGLVTGIGMAGLLARREEIEVGQWLGDPRLLGAAAVWLMVGLLLLGEAVHLVQFRTAAILTLLILAVLILGVIFRTSMKGAHDFTRTLKTEQASQTPDSRGGSQQVIEQP